MKKLLYLTLFFTAFANAQIVNIPDINFKTKLIANGVDTNADGNIQESEALVITNLAVSNSNITDLTGILSFANLVTLSCNTNFLNELNLNGLANLQSVNCSSNQLNDINLSGCFSLISLKCDNNSLINLDLSASPNLFALACDNNLLQTINIKNGGIQSFGPGIGVTDFWLNPTLQFVCADENEVQNVGFFLDMIMSNAVVNSYCSFTPGGNYNTITGVISYDFNNNGCDASDYTNNNIRVNISDGTTQGATFTNSTGNYTFYTQAGSFDITPNVENPSWFIFSPPTATIPFATNNNNTATQNFCITPNGVHPDLEVVIAPITPARPGFDATYKIVYKNKGNQTLSGDVSFTYDDTVLDFVSSTVIPNSQSTGNLMWNYANLQPFENRSFYITLNVNSATETPAVNIGNVLQFSATINPILSDEIPTDNLFNFNQTVVGSFDPNDITCLEGDMVSPTEIGNYLHYVINFENTGTSQAENIVVKIEINPSQFDVNSLQLLNASHEVDAKITGNKVEFIFHQIMLDTGGHGNVLLKIRSKDNLQQGDTVSKRADIFFDYNAPIDTGFANTTFQALNNAIHNFDDSISVAPNPTSSVININCNNTINSVEFYDVQGRLLQSKIQNGTSVSLDISSQSNGIYFVKINSDKGSKVEKIVKN